ncbi:acetylornithine deacetylase [Roseobacteraceae bacterium S113]
MKTIEILEKLIAFDTVSHKSNLDLIEYVEALLKTAGCRVTRLPSPCGTKAGLYAEIGPEVDGGLLLSAHTDVVPVEGQVWTKPPFTLTSEDDRFYGRGTTDMKGFIACALALATEARTFDLRRPLAIVLSYDEEIGCVGLQEIQAQLAPLLKAPRLCIVGEPTEMQVAIGHKGKTAFKAVFHGEAGHSALAPKFQNALHLAADFMVELRSLQSEITESGPFDDGYGIPYSTIHIGKLSGGTALNIVPDRAEMLFEFRSIPQHSDAQLLKRIHGIAAKLNDRLDVSGIELSIINRYPGLEVDSSRQEVADLVDLAGTRVTKVAFGTEAGILKEMGLPTVVCGPGSMSGQGHKADESIRRQQLTHCEATLSRCLDWTCIRME